MGSRVLATFSYNRCNPSFRSSINIVTGRAISTGLIGTDIRCSYVLGSEPHPDQPARYPGQKWEASNEPE
jgi:hypothetical protein